MIKIDLVMNKIHFAIACFAAVLLSCERDAATDTPEPGDPEVLHDEIILGEKLEDPYSVKNITKALEALYPTKAGAVSVSPTNLYVRFLPRDDNEMDTLLSLGIDVLDHPVEYRVVREGDWYHDPGIDEESITWQYAVVPTDFEFPSGIAYEVLDECYLAENDPVTRADDGIDWSAVERMSYVLTGNGEMLSPTTKGGSDNVPSGRITVTDAEYAGGKPVGLSEVKVCCNSFVKFSVAYTDRDGNYHMDRSFSTQPRYRIVFQNRAGFSQGLNLILVSASVATLGKGPVSGLDVNVTDKDDERLWRRCVVNNAAWEYVSRCKEADLDLTAPPTDLRIWVFKNLKDSSTPMLHHGAIVDIDLVKKYLGDYSSILKRFLPDVTIGTKGGKDYPSIYASVIHELAHTSHYMQVGNTYWNKYITYILKTFLTEGGEGYGSGFGVNAWYCGIGEMWGYFLADTFLSDRYGPIYNPLGTEYWFHPEIFTYLYNRTFSRSELLRALKPSVTSLDDLEDTLISLYPARETMIRQVFNRYR